jgi:hypothetical protein
MCPRCRRTLPCLTLTPLYPHPPTQVSHHRPRLVAPHLPALLPVLYAQTEVRQDLIRTVDLGPFKHKVRWGGVLVGQGWLVLGHREACT